MSFKEFQDGHHGCIYGGHLGYRKGTILAILNLYVAPMPPIMFRLNLTCCLGEEMWFEEFKDGHRGGHLGYRNGTILAILNLCVTVMPPIKFWLNQTLAAILDIGTERF